MEACSALESIGTALPEPATGADPPAVSSGAVDRQLLEQMQAAVTSLRAIPAPAAHRDDIDAVIDIIATSADRYEAALPQMRAAARRLERAMKSIDEADLPPAPEGTTVAGGIMAQMMAVPAVRDAFNAQLALYEELGKGIDEKEAERLAKAVGLDRCPKEKGEPALTAAQLERCGSRGKPVSVQALVDIFRAHEISLAIDEHTCTVPLGKRVGGFDSDATTTESTEPELADRIRREQGYVLCNVDDAGVDHQLVVNKWDTDTETSFRVHNVDCVLYPYSPAVEAKQVGRVKKAMEGVRASVPTP